MQSGADILTTQNGFPYFFHSTDESIAQLIGEPTRDEQKEAKRRAEEARERKAAHAFLSLGESSSPSALGTVANDAADALASSASSEHTAAKEDNKDWIYVPPTYLGHPIAYSYAGVTGATRYPYNPFNAGHTGWPPVNVPVFVAPGMP